MSTLLERLGEGIKKRDVVAEGAALIKKWEATSLLEGIEDSRLKQNLAVLFEQQTKQLLKESSLMARSGGGDVEGFASVAFPIVRRVFASLIANDLVSVQPMSLPSGLIFFLDFKYTDNLNNAAARLYAEPETSIYGGGRLAAQITGGVLLTGSYAEDGFYHMNQGYSSPTGSATIYVQTVLSGTYGGAVNTPGTVTRNPDLEADLMKLCQYDPEFVSGTTTVAIGRVSKSDLDSSGFNLNTDNLMGIVVSSSGGHRKWAATDDVQIRRLQEYSGSATDHILVFNVSYTGARTPFQLSGAMGPTSTFTYPIEDVFANGGALGSIQGQDQWGLEADPGIPEIDIKVNSVSVTAITKKLKAKWSPELGQDLSAYHNMDAEVELTKILSEQIALEIDREILVDLMKGATAGVYYWSRSPGMFLNRETGVEIGSNTKAPDFTGTVKEWYETLLHTVQDLSAVIHRKTLRGGANFLVCGPETAAILEQTSTFRASVTSDVEKGTAGAVKEGNLNKKWDIWVDPYFPRNVILVGRKGSSFLESGYVYAPYVPLQVTPTIFGPEDFVPRKGVMTRYARKMVRPDMYGLVIIRGLLGESGT